MITLTDYDSSNGDARKIFFNAGKVEIKNVGGASVLESLINAGIAEVERSYLERVFGSSVDIAMVALGLPYNDEFVKYKT